MFLSNSRNIDVIQSIRMFSQLDNWVPFVQLTQTHGLKHPNWLYHIYVAWIAQKTFFGHVWCNNEPLQYYLKGKPLDYILIYCALFLYELAFTSVISVFIHPAVNITFSQMTYTVPESEEVMLKISLDEAHVEDITLMITTMDITAQCE